MRKLADPATGRLFAAARGCRPVFFWPPRSRASVSCYAGERAGVERLSRHIFGRSLSGWEYAGMAGAPDLANVKLAECDGQIRIETDEPRTLLLHAIHHVRRERAGLVIVTEALCIGRLRMQRKGLGLRIFARQLANADQLEVGHISTTAGRRADENGYYTWPRFGFDGPLSGDTIDKLPAGMEHARHIVDLMCCEKGRLWWKEHGETIPVRFDVGRGGSSQERFSRYVCGRLGSPWPKKAR